MTGYEPRGHQSPLPTPKDPGPADIVLTEELSGELELVGPAVDPGRVVRPGDVLVVSAAHNVTPGAAERCSAELERRFPDLAAVIVLTGMRFEFVYRSEQ